MYNVRYIIYISVWFLCFQLEKYLVCSSSCVLYFKICDQIAGVYSITGGLCTLGQACMQLQASIRSQVDPVLNRTGLYKII